MHEMLDLAKEKEGVASIEQRDALIEQLNHAVASGKYSTKALFCTDRVESYQGLAYVMTTWEPIDETYKILRVCSAIRRGDAAELDELLKQGQDLTRRSNRFHLIPIDLAAKKGNGDVMRVIVKHGCPISYPHEYNFTKILSVASRSGNKEAVEVLMEENNNKDMQGTRGQHDIESAARSAARVGKFEIVEFLIDQCTSYHAEYRYAAFVEGVQGGQVAVVEALLNRGGFDPHAVTGTFPTGPILGAILNCKPANQVPVIVKMLLKHGVDPNRVYPGMAYAPLQKALKNEDVATAILLLEHGANADTRMLLPGCKGKNLSPVLLQAVKMENNALIRLLLDKGANPIMTWKEKGVHRSGP